MHARLHAFAFLCALALTAAPGQAAYTASLGPDATLGDWTQWNAPHNEYLLTVTLDPDGATDPIRLINVDFDWDDTRLQPVGAPVAGPLFDGQPDPWFAWYDLEGHRTVSHVLLGSTSGVTPTGPVILFTQLFRATGTQDGEAALDLLSLVLRGPLNQPIISYGEDQALVTVDLTAPQEQAFDMAAQSPVGDQLWTALPTVNAALSAGDGTVAAFVATESALLPANEDAAWTAPPFPATLDLSAGDGLKTVSVFVRDAYGNRRALADSITLDTIAPDYEVSGLDARPRHQGAQLNWNLPAAAPDFDRVRVYRHGWCDDGLSRYPEFDDSAPMSPWPTTEPEALAAGFALVYEGAASARLDAVTPRDVQRYVAFCVDHAGNVGVAGAGARDRCTNYILGDVRTPWDGIVFVGDLVRLAASYGTLAGQPGYDAHLDYGPTDDMSRAGVPLTDNRVDFEDLMIHAMNYGPTSPILSMPAVAKGGVSGADALAIVRLETQEGGLALLLNSGEAWLGLHLLLEWGDPRMATVRDAVGDGLLHRSEPGRLLFDRVRMEGEDMSGLLALLDFGPDGLPADLRVAELDLRDAQNQALGAEAVAMQGEEAVAAGFQLEPNHPNPFNPVTSIAYRLDAAATVRLSVFNSLGQRVAVLADGPAAAGRHEALFDAGALASGIYICRLEAEGRLLQRKMVLVK